MVRTNNQTGARMMRTMMRRGLAALAGAAMMAGAAQAATVAVPLGSMPTPLTTFFGTDPIPQGTGVTGNMGTGVAFDLGPNAWTADPWYQNNDDVSLTMNTSLQGVQQVQMLMNTLWGRTDLVNSTISVSFVGLSGQTYTVDLFSGDELRDYAQNPSFAGAIDGTSGSNGVDAVAWWTATGSATNTGRRIDMLTIDLPASFLGDELVQIIVNDTGNAGQRRALLMAVNAVTSPVPVPGALLLFVGGLGLMARIRRA